MDLLSEINPAILMSALIFGAVSSLHCFAMCGPLAFQAKGNPIGQLSYQAGRFLSYQAMGFIIYSIASSVFSELKQGIQEYTLYLLVAIYLIIGIKIIYQKKSTLPSDHLFSKLYNQSFQRIALLQKKKYFALLLGLISGLLPCGLLHTFLLGVIPLQNPLMVMLYVSAFWLATTPALTISAYSLDYLKQRLAGSFTTLQGLTFIGLSLYVLFVKHQALITGQCQ